MNVLVILSLNMNHAPRVTKMGAKLANNVEFATVVKLRDQCQVIRSKEKNIPAQNNLKKSFLVEGFLEEPDLSSPNQIQKTGTAKANLQKAVAEGDNSLSFTKTGEKAMRTAPQIKDIRDILNFFDDFIDVYPK